MKKIIITSIFAAFAFLTNAQVTGSCRLSVKVRYKWDAAAQNCIYTGKLANVCAKLVCGGSTGRAAKPATDELLLPYTINKENKILIAEFNDEDAGKDAQNLLKDKSIKITDAVVMKQPSTTITNGKTVNSTLNFTLKPGDYKIEALPSSGNERVGKRLKWKLVIHIEINN
jgi:hypothetical protein